MKPVKMPEVTTWCPEERLRVVSWMNALLMEHITTFGMLPMPNRLIAVLECIHMVSVYPVSSLNTNRELIENNISNIGR